MSLLQLLKTCERKMRIRIIFGSDNHYFDIADADQKETYTEYLEWAYKASPHNDCTPEVAKWNIKNITYTEYTKDGDCIETKEDILVIYLE